MYQVSKLYPLEPNQEYFGALTHKLCKSQLQVEFLDLPGENIPPQDAGVDAVVSTFPLCTIPGVVEAIQRIEHGIVPDPAVQNWQRRTQRRFRWASKGCHLPRHIPRVISDGGFPIEPMEVGSGST